MLLDLVSKTMLFGIIFNIMEKKIFSKYLPLEITKRPTKRHSYFIPEDPEKEGFPSGRSQIACFLATYLTLTGKFNDFLVPIWLVTILICIQRVTSRVHTLFQVVSGAFFGFFFAFVSTRPIPFESPEIFSV